jgi:hypothetical protein
MRIGSVLLIIWLIIGAVAAGQRHYFSRSRPSCAQTSTVLVTGVAGPLNYVGANPKVSCTAEQAPPVPVPGLSSRPRTGHAI